MIDCNRKLITFILILFAISSIAQVDTINVKINDAEEAVKAAEAAVEEVVEGNQSSKSTPRSLSMVSEREVPSIDDDDTLRLYSESYKGLELLDSVVGNYEVFITGENHTYTESNARLWFKMIKYLNEKAGVRNIMFEYGQTYGFLVNEYLKTGDTVLFNSIDRFAYPEYSEVIKELKVYNDSLPSNRKLHFTAIDIDRGLYPIVKALDYLMANDSLEPSDSITLHVQSIRSLANYNDYKLDEEGGYSYRGFQFKTGVTLDLVAANFKTNRQDYISFLGENYEAFRKIIEDQYTARQKWSEYQKEGAVQEYIFRENYMHQVFLKEREEFTGNWFGQFGRCHTTKTKKENNSCEWFEFNSLAERIKNTAGGELQNKVLTLAQVYDTDRDFGPMHSQDKDGFRRYFEDMPTNGLVVFDIKNDSLLNANYGNDFDYLIFNTNNQRGETYDYLNTENDDDSDENKTSFSFGVGEQSIDLAAWSQQFVDQGYISAFSSPMAYYEFELSNAKNGWVNTTNFGFFQDQSSFAGSTEWTLNGYFIKSTTGYDILKKKDWIDLVPAGGIGFQELTSSVIEYADSTSLLQQGFVGEEKHTIYTNPAFIFDFNGLIAFNIWKIRLGTKAGYILDVSKKKWRTGEVLLQQGPETSLSGFYQTLFLGISF